MKNSIKELAEIFRQQPKQVSIEEIQNELGYHQQMIKKTLFNNLYSLKRKYPKRESFEYWYMHSMTKVY